MRPCSGKLRTYEGSVIETRLRLCLIESFFSCRKTIMAADCWKIMEICFEGVCFIPIYYSVIILFLTDATVLRILLIRSCAVKKPFRLSFYILPAGCRQSLFLHIAVAAAGLGLLR